MPVFRQYIGLEVVRNIRAFLNLETGIVRSGTSEPEIRSIAPKMSVGATAPTAPLASNQEAAPQQRTVQQGQELWQFRKQLEEKEQENARLRAQLAAGNYDSPADGVKPENIIWLFGSGRTGSSWLSSMIREMPGYALWGEPLVGKLFGDFYHSRFASLRADNPHFILPMNQKELWRRAIRAFILESVHARFAGADYLLISEPNSSAGAHLIMEVLPESRLILLIRDPRDIVASFLDASRKGGWLRRHAEQLANPPESLADTNPDAFVSQRAQECLQNMSWAREAYQAHRGPKVLVRYEDLRADTLGTMKRIYSTLGLPVEEGELVPVVKERLWENFPVEKGPGKFFRKAKPGGWRDDLTPEQAKIVEQITKPLLKEYYSD